MARTSSSTPTEPAPAEQGSTPRPRPYGMATFQALVRLVSAPDLRYTPSGAAVVNFSVALNDRAGKPHYLDVALFGAGAETLAKYGTKGRALVLSGRITTHSWESSDGTRRKSVDLIAEEFHFAERAPRAGDNAGGEPATESVESPV